jgi:hypothetical protein
MYFYREVQDQCLRDICYLHFQSKIFFLEDGGSWFFRKAGSYQYAMSHSRRIYSYVRVNRKVAGILLFVKGKDDCKGKMNKNR